MPSLWVIDGFNLLRQSQDLTELEARDYPAARSVLLNRLKNFAELSGERVICVFDAMGSVNAERVEEPHGPVKFLFTRSFETADEVIIEMARAKKEAIIVVSSDREILKAAQKAGSATMGSPDFDRLLFRLEGRSKIPREEEETQGFDPRRGTQKKGPAFRRAKKDRKVFGKIKKIDSKF